MLYFRAIHVFRVYIHQKVFIVKLALLTTIAWQDLRREHFFNVLYVDQMGNNLSLLQKSYEGNCRHFFILKLHFSVCQKHPIFSFQTPIILLYVNEIQILHFLFIISESLYRILHKHFPIDLIHDHYAVHFLSKQLVIQSVLIRLVIMIYFLPKLVQKDDELLL